jgi:hypothetical protein
VGASLHLTTGDPVEAAAIGHRALDTAATLNSWRAVENLRELDRRARERGDVPVVPELGARLRPLAKAR